MSNPLQLKQIIEGAIMAADQPLSLDLMVHLFEVDPPDKATLREVLAEIAADCEGRGFELKEVASGYRFQVRSDYGEWVSRLWEERPARYTRALLETLALIAYKQPITRGDIEDVRGVTVSTNIMRSLLEREWIRVVGHRDVPGRPAIYATTRGFLDYFNLKSLDELPTLSEIKDLDKMNEELDLEEEIVEARSLELAADGTTVQVDAGSDQASDSESISDDAAGAGDPADAAMPMTEILMGGVQASAASKDASLVEADEVADDPLMETLDAVTERVNEIQRNIKNLYREDAADGSDGDGADAER